MKIQKYWFWEMPDDVSDTVVVIDAYAATTNLVLILSQNPKNLILVNSTNYQKVKSAYPDSIVVGESLTLPSNFFDVTNLPVDIAKSSLQGKTIIYMSINGTKVIDNIFNKSKLVLACSFTNIKAVKNYLLNKKIGDLTIIMAGDEEAKVDEDKICADVLTMELTDKSYNWNVYLKKVKDFINSYYINSDKRKESLPYVLDLNIFNIVPIVVISKQGFLEIKNTVLQSRNVS